MIINSIKIKYTLNKQHKLSNQLMSNFGNSGYPTLIEGNIRSFLMNKLKNSHHISETYYNGLFNIMLLIIFLVIVGGYLMFKYKYKEKPNLAQKDFEKQQYILSTIRNQQLEKMRNHQELITGLPHWDTEYSV